MENTRILKKGNQNIRNRSRQRRVFRRILAAVVFAFLIWLGNCLVTANAKTNKEEKRYKYYTTIYINRDMTLWEIATEYSTEEYTDKRGYIDEVMEINQLNTEQLAYGSTICIPYYSSEYK